MPAYLTVSSGRAVPVLLKVSKPARRSTKTGRGMSEVTASIAALAAWNIGEGNKRENGEILTGMTSFPIPSAGMRPMVRLDLALADRVRTVRNMKVSRSHSHIRAYQTRPCLCLLPNRNRSSAPFHHIQNATIQTSSRGTHQLGYFCSTATFSDKRAVGNKASSTNTTRRMHKEEGQARQGGCRGRPAQAIIFQTFTPVANGVLAAKYQSL